MGLAVERDGARDPARGAFLAVSVEDVGEFLLAGAVDDVGGAAAFAAHAHVEGAIEAEREAPLGLVELHGRDPDVEHDAVQRRQGQPFDHGIERAEPGFDQCEPRLVGVAGEAGRDGRRVAVERHDARSGGGEDRRRIAARPEGAVDVETAGPDRQGRDGLRSEHGMVSNRSASGEVTPRAAIRHQSRAPGGCGTAGAAACPELSCFR